MWGSLDVHAPQVSRTPGGPSYLAACGARGPEVATSRHPDTDLARLVAAWAVLPEAVRRMIMAAVKANGRPAP